MAGEVPVHLPGAAAELPLSKALNPNCSSGAAQWRQIRLWLYWAASRCECECDQGVPARESLALSEPTLNK